MKIDFHYHYVDQEGFVEGGGWSEGILVADDQEVIRLDTIKVIRKMDLRSVFQASDGAEALIFQYK